MEISIVIPAYNEEKRIGKSLAKIIKYCDRQFKAYEILVVDDCSTDRTLEVVAEHSNNNVRILKNSPNRGKGYSVKRGILNAKYSLVLFSDSDLATPIEELTKFIKYNEEGYDIVIASRNLKDSIIATKQPFYRQIGGKAFAFLVRIISLNDFRDTQCGFKLFEASAAKRIVKLQTFDRFSFDVELLYIAKKYGYKIKEAPVRWFDQPGSKVSLVRDGASMFLDLIKIRINDLRGQYENAN